LGDVFVKRDMAGRRIGWRLTIERKRLEPAMGGKIVHQQSQFLLMPRPMALVVRGRRLNLGCARGRVWLAREASEGGQTRGRRLKTATGTAFLAPTDFPPPGDGEQIQTATHGPGARPESIQSQARRSLHIPDAPTGGPAIRLYQLFPLQRWAPSLSVILPYPIPRVQRACQCLALFLC